MALGRKPSSVENITYLCSKVHIENEGTAGAMCYTEFQHGREIEVCVCESRAGMQPCNGAATMALSWRPSGGGGGGLLRALLILFPIAARLMSA